MTSCVNKTSMCSSSLMAKGLCTACYKRQHRAQNLEKIKRQEREAYWAGRDSKLQVMRKHKYSAKGRFNYMQWDSRKRGLSCTLSLLEYSTLISLNCYYCEEPLPDSRCTGLDRIDNKRGYEIDNVLPCCGDCNLIRMNKLTVEETKVAVEAVQKFRIHRELGRE